MTPTPAQVIARRREERAALIAAAERYARDLDPRLGVRAVAVVGSVARGDWHEHSDVDVVVVAERLPATPTARLRALGWPPPLRVQPVAWTPEEYAGQLARGNPIAVEAERDGVWLVGAPTGSAAGSGASPDLDTVRRPIAGDQGDRDQPGVPPPGITTPSVGAAARGRARPCADGHSV